MHNLLGLRELHPRSIRYTAHRSVQHGSRFDLGMGQEICLAVRILAPLLTLKMLSLVCDRSDDLGERMKAYEEWIYTAQVKSLAMFSLI